ncbi:MAG: hypothetical protein O3A46_16490 [Candidatus Poribacteria bacterium]|nr:hypothetical protein [Candidatus Poribacteria bacterium]
MKRIAAFSALLVLVVTLSGCWTHTHVVGDGAQGNDVTSTRQWYVLFGLIPLNEVDSKAMAGDAANYTVETQTTLIDAVIGAFTGVISVHPQTVTVTVTK